MAYAFKQAKYYTKNGLKEARAIVLHMAEGGGTVSHLTHPPNDNSSHFVVEHSGHVVQMVGWGDADHSLHIDRPHGPPGPGDCHSFSLDVARNLLGAAGIADPNAYLIAVEIEGWAKDHTSGNPPRTVPAGPKPAQVKALRDLIDDLRNRYPTLRGVLGHRDFQNYKACPGCHVFDKVHHDAFTDAGPNISAGPLIPAGPIIPGGGDMPGLALTFADQSPEGVLAIPINTVAIIVSTGAHYTVPQAVKRPVYATAQLLPPQAETGYLVVLDGQMAFVRKSLPGLSYTPDA